MRLFKPFWMSKHPEIRIEAVGEIKDKKLLEKIVFESEYDDVKHVAINNISELPLLKKIILQHPNKDVRLSAMSKIYNDKALLELIDECMDEKIIKEIQIHRLNYGYSKNDEKKEENVNDRDEDGCTLLIKAVIEGDSDRVEELIETGADINLGDDSGNTPLSSAAEYGQIEILRKLIQEGANIEKANNCGSTPLISAVMAGRSNSVTTLINWGASVHAKNNDNETVLSLAEEGMRNALLEQEVNGPFYERDFDRVEDYKDIIKIVKKLLS